MPEPIANFDLLRQNGLGGHDEAMQNRMLNEKFSRADLIELNGRKQGIAILTILALSGKPRGYQGF
jgi:hypothetical protein